MKLSDLACKNAKPQERAYKLFDGGGLYLEVTPTGRRYWKMKYRLHDKEKKLSFGVYPEVSLIDARKEREKAKELLRNSSDPSHVKRERKRAEKFSAEHTFKVVSEEWHARYKDRWSKSHADNLMYRLTKDIYPSLGSYKISEVTAPILFDCIQRIDNNGKHETAKRALQVCGQIMRYAVVTGRAQRDPSPELRGSLKRYNKKHFASIDIDKLPELIKKINSNEARLFRQTVLALKLMMLTFVRTGELMNAEWKEFDLKRKSWVIPAHRMKMRIEHFVPLSKQAIKILEELKKDSSSQVYVFPSISKPGKPMSNGTILMALDRMGYRGEMTGHGFRSLAMSTIKEKLRYPHEVIDRQLAHLPVKAVDKAYDRAKFNPDRVKMMQDWADYIEKLTKNSR